jgi:hypothetical protein
MIPDYALIAEIMLFAEGFETAKVLSKKMVQVFKNTKKYSFTLHNFICL